MESLEGCICREGELGHSELRSKAIVHGKGSGESVYLGARLEAGADEVAGAQQQAVEVGPARGERRSHGDGDGDGESSATAASHSCKQVFPPF